MAPAQPAPPAPATDPDAPARTVVLFENERFNALTRRWSSASLLPTDRRAFSTATGAKSWRDRAEAEAWLLGRDWAWTGDWAPGGWEHARDFSRVAFDDARAAAATFDFVRRRRLERPAAYANDVSARACVNVDVEAAARVRARLGDAVARACIVAGGDDADADVAGRRCRGFAEELRDALLSPKAGRAFGARGAALVADVDAFLEAARRKRSGLGAIFARAPDASPAAAQARVYALQTSGALPAELTALARACVRAYDVDGAGACDGSHAPRACPFAAARCANDGCAAICSRRALPAHDATCDFKRERCACGVMVQRFRRDDHLAGDCAKRLVDCPFGCAHRLPFEDLGAHLDEAAPAHALLLLKQLDASKRREAATLARLDEMGTALAEERAARARTDAALAGLTASLEATRRLLRNTTAQATEDLRSETKKTAAAAAAARRSADDARQKIAALSGDVARLDAAVQRGGRPVAGRR